MSTSEKLTYLNTTKQELKQAINNLGGDITSQTTFRNYATELDTLYSNLPKVSGEGTSITLSPTLKGKMNIIPKGDTQQDGTPTPDTPIDIEVVTGTQEVKVENVNSINKSDFIASGTYGGVTYTNNNDGSMTFNGTSTSQLTFQITPIPNYFEESEFDTYSYKCFGLPSTCYTNIFYGGNFYGENVGTVNINMLNRNYAMVITIPSGTVFNNVVVKPMLVKGNYTSDTFPSYVEHQEQTQTISLGDIELCKIGNYQDYLYKSGDKWYKKEQIGKYTFTGNETYTTWTNNRVVIANTPNNYLKVTSNVTAPIICTHYKASSRDGIQTTNNAISFYATTDSASGTIVNDSEHNTNTLLKEFMTANNVEIYYVLATPNDIEITNETLIEQLDNLQKMKSYNGVTNINCSGNLSAILNVSALKGESN